METGAVAPPSAATLGLDGQGDDGQFIAAVVLLDPMAAPADSDAALPSSVNVAVYIAPSDDLPAISGPPAFEVKAVSIGNVVFDLADGYSLSIDELQSAVFVANALTGESILVWGAAEIALDGADAARFWGTTSVELGNGTKITMETAVDALVADLFRLDRLTVTRDDRAMVITGIAETTLGDLAVVQSFDGEAIDAATRDGLTIVSDLTGTWSDEYGNAVDQSVLDQTAVGGLYGPDQDTLSLGEICEAISSFVAYNQIDSLMLTIGRNQPSETERRPQAIDVYRSMALYAGENARRFDG
ncbi:DUF1521 domain-containing protein [Sphingosinicella sp. BN140058]|uniref:DUF1521 domain-containing protein n=1 Tax=Sphingosinicella sp. BN140058 TaxID=1892855 RepID=UPI0010121084|nr:DUF1521 domain-containing protein [Sphingosinicella sp. BN140058]QAY75565.1 DUF1521 domain-containing protein [Sphingosinicella sp. BN140058]